MKYMTSPNAFAILCFTLIFCLLACGKEKELSKEEAFEQFMKKELHKKGKDQKVKAFMLSHYSFENSENLYYKGVSDDQNVSVFVEDENGDIVYSFRLVAEDEDYDYDDGFAVFLTKGDRESVNTENFSSNFRELAYFLFETDKEYTREVFESFSEYIQETMDLAKVNAKRYNLSVYSYGNLKSKFVIKREGTYGGKDKWYIKTKDGAKSAIYDYEGIPLQEFWNYEKDSYNPSVLDYDLTEYSWVGWGGNDATLQARSNCQDQLSAGKLNTQFVERCEGVVYPNCGKLHATNLLLKYKNEYYGIDQWFKIL